MRDILLLAARAEASIRQQAAECGDPRVEQIDAVPTENGCDVLLYCYAGPETFYTSVPISALGTMHPDAFGRMVEQSLTATGTIQ